ncbi:MAG: hypothetical protein ABTQ32_09510 [Myxococcaceae bacterium]
MTFAEGAAADARSLLARFDDFVVRSRRIKGRVRLGLSVSLAIGLAFVASRVEQPLAVGLCGIALLGVVWLATALLVPMSLMGRAQLANGGGATMQSGVAVAFEPRGLSAGEESFPWPSVSSVRVDGGGVTIEGVDEAKRRVFRIELSPRNFLSAEGQQSVVAEVERLRRS